MCLSGGMQDGKAPLDPNYRFYDMWDDLATTASPPGLVSYVTNILTLLPLIIIDIAAFDFFNNDFSQDFQSFLPGLPSLYYIPK